MKVLQNWWRQVAFLLLGALLSWVGNYYYYSKARRDAEATKDQEIARYVVAAGSHGTPIVPWVLRGRDVANPRHEEHAAATSSASTDRAPPGVRCSLTALVPRCLAATIGWLSREFHS